MKITDNINIRFNVCFGLGLFFSRYIVLSDDCRKKAYHWAFKLVIGPFLLNGHFRVGKWEPSEF